MFLWLAILYCPGAFGLAQFPSFRKNRVSVVQEETALLYDLLAVLDEDAASVGVAYLPTSHVVDAARSGSG